MEKDTLKSKIKEMKYRLFQKYLDIFHPDWSDKRKIRGLICYICLDYGVNPILGLLVAYCESKFNPQAININPDKSEDVGLFQWNLKHHPEITKEEALDPIKSTMFFCQAVCDGFLWWWKSSQKCWGVPGIATFIS